MIAELFVWLFLCLAVVMAALVAMGVTNPGTVLLLGALGFVVLGALILWMANQAEKKENAGADAPVDPTAVAPQETSTFNGALRGPKKPTPHVPRVFPHDEALGVLLPRLRNDARFVGAADVVEGALRLAKALNKTPHFDDDLLNLANNQFEALAAFRDCRAHFPNEVAALDTHLNNAVEALHGHAKSVAQELSAGAIASFSIRQKVIDIVPA